MNNLVVDVLKERIETAGSQKAVADDLEMSPAHLSDVLMGKRNLSRKYLDKLGLTRVIVHVHTEDEAHLRKLLKRLQEPKK